jgi:hypothetical protein
MVCFHHLLTNNLGWWYRNGLMEYSRKAIYQKMTEASPGLSEITDTFGICCFIDCNCLETSRCGGGPTEGGANAARWSDYMCRRHSTMVGKVWHVALQHVSTLTVVLHV